MKRWARMLALAALTAMPVHSQTSASAFPDLHGPYLGQTPPGAKAVLFAPGIVSTGMTEREIAVNREGTELFFEQSFGKVVTIMATRIENSRWTEPAVAPFAADLRFYHLEPCLSADEKTVYFLSNRPRAGEEPKPGWTHQNIWASQRSADGRWGEAYDLGEPVNSPDGEFYPSLTNSGTLYFSRSKASGESPKIMRSRRVDGGYQTPEPLPAVVNGKGSPYNACIAPDESYLIACVDGRDDSLTPKRANYYIFFRTQDDRWSEGINLGPEVNFPGTTASAPYVMRDGRYLFFGSNLNRDFDLPVKASLPSRRLLEYFIAPLNGSTDVYWIDAAFLQKPRPQDWK